MGRGWGGLGLMEQSWACRVWSVNQRGRLHSSPRKWIIIKKVGSLITALKPLIWHGAIYFQARRHKSFRISSTVWHHLWFNISRGSVFGPFHTAWTKMSSNWLTGCPPSLFRPLFNWARPTSRSSCCSAWAFKSAPLANELLYFIYETNRGLCFLRGACGK